MQTEIENRIVVDASVLGALFFRETEAQFLEGVLADKKWICPTLMPYEMGSIFLKKAKQNIKLKSELEECYKIFCDTDIECVSVLISAVIPIAKKYNLTVYDASYFWLAEHLNLELLTLDEKLKKAWEKRIDDLA